MKTLLTLVIIQREGSVLLGMKKRGFGAGRWNGFGGKVEAGETIQEAAHREVGEECGVTCGPLAQRAIVRFTFDDHPKQLEVHVFHTNQFAGDVIETNEMRPEWFEIQLIPYESMWTDDQYWLPQFLAGKHLIGNFHFSSIEDDGRLVSWDVQEVDAGTFSC